MTELLQNVEKVYKKWEARSSPNCGRLKLDSLRSKLNSRRETYENGNTYSSYSRSLNRDYRRTPRHRHTTLKYDGLAEFKMAPIVVSLRQPRPFVGKPCAKCVPHSRANIEDATVYLLGVHNILRIPYFPMQSFNICCFWNLFKLHPPLLCPDTPFDLLKCKRVEETIQAIVNAGDKEDDISDSVTAEKLYQKGQEILKDLKSSLSSICISITGFCLHHVLKRVFDRILVHKGQIEILKVLSQESIPFVYLPLHHSYFDYILVSYILHMNSLKSPFITVTDELCIPILNYFFRILGAIFVRNSLLVGKCSDDILYSTLAQSYIIRCLETGHDVQFFVEGHRSITGKPQIANSNLLSSIVQCVSEGSLEDAYLVPVSLTYEATEETFVAEQLGGHSKAEKSIFSKLHSLWRLMHLRYGNVRVNFNQPFSIKEFLQSNSARHPKQINSESNLAYQKQGSVSPLVDDLAVHVIYDATNCTSFMSSHLLAFLFVTQYRKGGTQQQLQSSMDWLRREILRKKCDIGFTGESLPVIKRAIDLLGKDLISTETIEMEWTSSDLENNNVKVKVYTPVVKLPHVLELRYYANTVVPLFLKESIVVNALYALVDVDICHFHHCDSRFYISRDILIEMAVKLCDFMKYEFIATPDATHTNKALIDQFRSMELIRIRSDEVHRAKLVNQCLGPCQDIVLSFNDVIDELIEKECLCGTGSDLYLKSKKKSRALCFNISSDEDECEDGGQQLKIDLREESISHLEFLRNILSPYIESYWLAACSLLRLIDEVKEESIFIHEMQTTAQDKLYKGLLAYEESFSADTLKNSLKMFCDRNIIEYGYEDNIKTIYLSEPYNSFESVNDVIADIEDFRK